MGIHCTLSSIMTSTIHTWSPGHCFNMKTIFPILKIRQSQECLISDTGIPILVRWHLYIETAPQLWNLSYIKSLVQDCNISIANVLEITLSCTKPLLTYHQVSNQAWEWVAMKKTENILQGGTPRKIMKQTAPFGAFWCILFNYKNGLRRPKKHKSVKKLKTLMPV